MGDLAFRCTPVFSQPQNFLFFFFVLWAPRIGFTSGLPQLRRCPPLYLSPLLRSRFCRRRLAIYRLRRRNASTRTWYIFQRPMDILMVRCKFFLRTIPVIIIIAEIAEGAASFQNTTHGGTLPWTTRSGTIEPFMGGIGCLAAENCEYEGGDEPAWRIFIR